MLGSFFYILVLFIGLQLPYYSSVDKEGTGCPTHILTCIFVVFILQCD